MSKKCLRSEGRRSSLLPLKKHIYFYYLIFGKATPVWVKMIFISYMQYII